MELLQEALKIRKAELSDMDALNHLLYLSKSHWGYDEAFMQAFMQKFSFTDAYLEKSKTSMVTFNGQNVAILSFSYEDTGELILDNFFIHPKYIRQGLG